MHRLIKWTLLAFALLTLAMAYATQHRQRSYEERKMKMQFVEQPKNVSATQIVTTTWAAEVSPQDTFLVVCIKLQDLMNIRAGKVNFIGDTKPKFGTLEELTDVYTASWLYSDNTGKPRMRPLMGNFNGGFQTYREAEQMCRDVWAQKDRYRAQIVQAKSGLVLPDGVLPSGGHTGSVN